MTHGLSRAQSRALWRNLVSRFPDEPRYAAQYVVELLLSENWADLDAFEPTARRYRSAELDARFIDVALERLDLAKARRMLDDYARRHGTSSDYAIRQYSFDCLSGNFGEAARIAGKLIGDLPRGQQPAARQWAQRAKFYQDIRQSWGSTGTREPDYDIFVINLDADTFRLERTVKQLSGQAFTRIPGVKGAYLPNFAVQTVTQGHGRQLKGTLGCFLSHVVAWEKIAAGERNVLVLEDDACIIAGLPESLAQLRLPQQFDLVFVNERLRPPGFSYRASRFRTVEASQIILSKPPDWSSAGTDGYVLSPKGAAKLLAMIERDGIAGDVDWRLVSYSLAAAERRGMIKRGGSAGRSLDFHEHFRTGRTKLETYVLLPSLVRQFSGGSVRLWDNELPNAEMALVTSLLRKRATPG